MSAAALAVKQFAGRAAPAVVEAGSYIGQGAGKARGRTEDALQGRGSTGWAIVGYALALILLYVLIADRRVVAASSKLVGGATTAAQAWVAPVDPIALLGQRFGYTPSSPSSPSSTASSTTPAAGGASSANSTLPAGIAPAGGNAGPTHGGSLPLPPLAAGAAGVAAAHARGASTNQILKLNHLYAAHGVHMTRASLRALSSGRESIRQAEREVRHLPWAPGRS